MGSPPCLWLTNDQNITVWHVVVHARTYSKRSLKKNPRSISTERLFPLNSGNSLVYICRHLKCFHWSYPKGQAAIGLKSVKHHLAHLAGYHYLSVFQVPCQCTTGFSAAVLFYWGAPGCLKHDWLHCIGKLGINHTRLGTEQQWKYSKCYLLHSQWVKDNEMSQPSMNQESWDEVMSNDNGFGAPGLWTLWKFFFLNYSIIYIRVQSGFLFIHSILCWLLSVPSRALAFKNMFVYLFLSTW